MYSPGPAPTPKSPWLGQQFTPKSYDQPYLPVIDEEWFTRILLMSGYRAYAYTPNNKDIQPFIVWVKPGVVVEWERRPLIEARWDEAKNGVPVKNEELPTISYTQPEYPNDGELTLVGKTVFRSTHMVVVSDEDGGMVSMGGYQLREAFALV